MKVVKGNRNLRSRATRGDKKVGMKKEWKRREEKWSRVGG